MKVEAITRKAAFLSRSSLACLRNVAAVNLAAGCAHGCVYCYTRGYSTYPGEGAVRLYADAADRLRDELRRKRIKPKAVYFSPSSDLFQPMSEVLDAAYDVLAVLLAAGIRVAFLTKGEIPQKHLDLLAKHATLVSAQMGLVSTDNDVLRAFEPGAPPAEVRLGLMGQLIRAGIATELRIDPILPGITDDANSLDRLISSAVAHGVKSLAASVLFLRPIVWGSLRRELASTDYLSRLEAAFGQTERLAIRTGSGKVMTLPRVAREELFDRVTAIASRYGVAAKICACKNPDLSAEPCGIAGASPALDARGCQTTLFG